MASKVPKGQGNPYALHPLCRVCQKDLSLIDRKVTDCVKCHSPQWCSPKCQKQQNPYHRLFCVQSAATTKEAKVNFFRIITQRKSAALFPFFSRKLGKKGAPWKAYLVVESDIKMASPRSAFSIPIWFPKWESHPKLKELRFELARQVHTFAVVALHEVGEDYQVYFLGGGAYQKIAIPMFGFEQGLVDRIELFCTLETQKVDKQIAKLLPMQAAKDEEGEDVMILTLPAARKKPPSSSSTRRRRRSHRRKRVG